MSRLLLPGAVLIAWASTQPAFAHITGSMQPHWHWSDTLGLTAVAALMAGAVWFDRRSR